LHSKKLASGSMGVAGRNSHFMGKSLKLLSLNLHFLTIIWKIIKFHLALGSVLSEFVHVNIQFLYSNFINKSVQYNSLKSFTFMEKPKVHHLIGHHETIWKMIISVWLAIKLAFSSKKMTSKLTVLWVIINLIWAKIIFSEINRLMGYREYTVIFQRSQKSQRFTA